MKKEIINIIKLVGINFKEIIVDIQIGDVIYHSVQLLDEKSIILHSFQEKSNIECNWNNLTIAQKKKVLKTLKPFLYN